MTLKKMLTFAAAAVAAVLLLTACSASGSGKTKVVLATNASPKPFSYEKDGKLTGYEVEVAKAVFKGLDDYELETEKTEWSAIFDGLNSERYQVAVNNISYTDERAESYLYSAPIASNPLSLIVPKDSDITGLDSIGGKSTEVVQGTATLEQLKKYNDDHKDNQTKISYTEDNIQSILNRVNDGQYDYKLFEGITAETIIKDQGLNNLKVVDLPAETQPFIYILFAKGQEDLRDKVNDRLKELEADGTLAKLSEKYLGGSYVPKAEELVTPKSK